MNKAILSTLAVIWVATLSNPARATCISPPLQCPCTLTETLGYNQSYPAIAHLIKGTVVLIDGGYVEFSVDEYLSNEDNNLADLERGDIVGGQWSGQYPCASVTLRLEPGQQVFAIYSLEMDRHISVCPTPETCYQTNCEPLTSEQERENCFSLCEHESQDECEVIRGQDLSKGNLFLTPWRDTLDLGDGYRVPSMEHSIIEDQSTCNARWPLEPRPPCDDTPGVVCSVSTLSQPRRDPPHIWLAASLVILLLSSLRRYGQGPESC